MTTWEIEPSTTLDPHPQGRSRRRRDQKPFAEYGCAFNDRRGTGVQTFSQRLARARLLYLRRDENGANWLALSVLAIAVSLPSLFHRVESHPAEFYGVHALPSGDTSGRAANPATHLESTAVQVKNV